jgi:hypothetical protein
MVLHVGIPIMISDAGCTKLVKENTTALDFA